MQLTLTPIEIFQRTQKEFSTEHQSDVRSSKLGILLTFALAAMAGKVNVTNENLIGARIFIDTLLNLAEPPDVVKRMMPQKDLRTDAERLADIKAQQKKKAEKK